MDHAAPPPGAVILHPAHSYRRAPPALAGCWCPDPDLLAYFYNVIRQREAACPAEYLLRLDRAHVFEGQFVLTADGAWLAPSVVDWPGADAALATLLQRVRDADVAQLPPSSRPTMVIGKAGAQNYGHTVVEILPKLVNLGRSGLQDVRLLLPEGMAAFTPLITLLLERLGLRAELAFDLRHQLTEVRDLVYIGPVSQHNTRKSATLLAWRDLVRSCLGVTPQPSRRLYVERPGTDHRSLDNAAEARGVLEAHGFETVHPGTMGFADQVALFAQASHIAGPLGAGLTNMLFAPAECRVTMIDPGLADYFFWDLATLAGQPFTWLFTGPVSHYSWDLAAGHYTVDPNALRYVLDRFNP